MRACLVGFSGNAEIAGPDIDGLDIAGLDIDGRCVGTEQLTELKLQNCIPRENFHSVARKAKLTS